MRFRRMRQLSDIQLFSLTIALGVFIPTMIILLVAKGAEIDAYMFHSGGFFGFLMIVTVLVAIVNMARNRW